VATEVATVAAEQSRQLLPSAGPSVPKVQGRRQAPYVPGVRVLPWAPVTQMEPTLQEAQMVLVRPAAPDLREEQLAQVPCHPMAGMELAVYHQRVRPARLPDHRVVPLVLLSREAPMAQVPDHQAALQVLGHPSVPLGLATHPMVLVEPGHQQVPVG